MNRIKAVCEK